MGVTLNQMQIFAGVDICSIHLVVVSLADYLFPVNRFIEFITFRYLLGGSRGVGISFQTGLLPSEKAEHRRRIVFACPVSRIIEVDMRRNYHNIHREDDC